MTGLAESLHFQFGTKAETLEELRGQMKSAKILQSYFFKVQDWQSDQKSILKKIKEDFKNQSVIVRSSASNEDLDHSSMAGAFTSCLNVDVEDEKALIKAIDDVVASYSGLPEDQVLVQPMLKNVSACGVATTHVISDGAPYYVFNYDDESGKTDSITGGTGVNKTVLLHHDVNRKMIESERIARWLEVVKELQFICGRQPLDIEFAELGDKEVYILQLRVLAASKNWQPDVEWKLANVQKYIEDFVTEQGKEKQGVFGKRSILGIMPDWNPAEIIGTSPRPLAVSLYRTLITDRIWAEARTRMGYRNVKFEPLMLMIGGRPFIDVRNSFNSFLPRQLSKNVGEKIVNGWLDRLAENVQFHDKVEFEVANTIYDFDFEKAFKDRYAGLLSDKEFREYRARLHFLTRQNCTLSEGSSLFKALKLVEKLSLRQEESGEGALRSLHHLVHETRQWGTLPFAIIARHGFMAESLLRSAARVGAINDETIEAFKSSLQTVTSDLSNDFARAHKDEALREKFLSKYGHLRPGTYDILSLRYDQREDLFSAGQEPKKKKNGFFELSKKEEKELGQLLSAHGFDFYSAKEFFEYARQAIVGRENSKFIFTRHLSQLLEQIALWGEKNELGREELSYLKIHQILDLLHSPLLKDPKKEFNKWIEAGKEETSISQSLHLHYLIRDVRDLYVIPLHRSAANFITDQKIEAQIAQIDSQSAANIDLKGKIVCIENADPGFDWIFTRGIAGLITKYGGSNSHMAIRCAEFELPAAIGCGEQSFERVIEAGYVEIDAQAKTVKPIHG